MIIEIVVPKRVDIGFKNIERGIGIKSTISMSNTRNRTARRKKRREKGRRALFFGSKPHS